MLYSCFNFGTRWGGLSVPHPGFFPLGKGTQYPLYRRLGGPQAWSGWVQKISPPLGCDPVQPIASCYTNYAILAHRLVSLPILDLTAFIGHTLHIWNHQSQVVLQKAKEMEILGSGSSRVKLCLDGVEGHVDVSLEVNRSDSLCTR